MRAFNGILEQERIRVLLHTRVTGITVDDTTVTGVTTESGVIPVRQVILATGGSSYPKTGTTGDGYRWAATIGHTVVKVRPALAPIQINPSVPREWQGIALRACGLSAVQDGRRLTSWEGDLLFTHEGLSGPCALEISRETAMAMERGTVHIVVDVFPGQEFDAVDRLLGQEVSEHRQRTIGTMLDAVLPNRMVDAFLTPIGVDPQTRGHVLTREARRAIVRTLKAWDLGVAVRIAVERGEVSAGGIALNEVDPHTMRSRIISGLYPCGEVLDIAGPIGGYNLQAAFSTGFVAGETAALDQKRILNSDI
jgi:predicted Rossmann fold flavoprotein